MSVHKDKISRFLGPCPYIYYSFTAVYRILYHYGKKLVLTKGHFCRKFRDLVLTGVILSLQTWSLWTDIPVDNYRGLSRIKRVLLNRQNNTQLHLSAMLVKLYYTLSFGYKERESKNAENAFLLIFET